MNRPVKKLFDLEIDEVSVVDRPANQHGLIAFAKNDTQEDHMAGIYDTDGDPVDEESLEHGDVVYDEDGNEYVFVEEGVEVEYDDSDQLVGAGVAKAGPLSWAATAATGSGAAARNAGKWLKKNKRPLIGGGLTGAAIGGGTVGLAKKSLGDDVLEQLSKAVTDFDKEEIIAKALNEVEIAKAETAELRKALEEAEDARITEAFISKAGEYNLPVAPSVLGPILKAVAEVLSDEQLDVLDALFTSIGDVLYDEIGYVGDTDNNSVIHQVDAFADELVGKSDNVSKAEAMVALFEANPAAYDAYIAENGR